VNNHSGLESSPDQELLHQLQEAVLEYDSGRARSTAEKLLTAGVDPMAIMNRAITPAARLVGDKFENGECFLPHLVMAGDIMSEIATLLEESAPATATEGTHTKVVVIGTVKGDVHSIGKNIVAMLMKANEFKVHDLGVDVPAARFVEQAEEKKADMIAMSSLLTTTMPYQREVVEELTFRGLRDKYKILLGGGPVSQEWADEIGADGYGKDAIAGVKVARRILGLS